MACAENSLECLESCEGAHPEKKTVTFQSIWQEASLVGLVRDSSFTEKGHVKKIREMKGPKMLEFLKNVSIYVVFVQQVNLSYNE